MRMYMYVCMYACTYTRGTNSISISFTAVYLNTSHFQKFTAMLQNSCRKDVGLRFGGLMHSSLSV